jgi:hypothetical protein
MKKMKYNIWQVKLGVRECLSEFNISIPEQVDERFHLSERAAKTSTRCISH